MIPEKEREALMRLTMCAREECGMCKYEKNCNFDFQCELATESMNILADALRRLNSSEKPNNSTISKMEQVDKDINVRSKDEPQTECNGCKFVGTYDTEFPCANCSRKTKDYYAKDEPQTSGVVWTEDAIKDEPKSYSTWASTDEPQTCGTCKHMGDYDWCNGCYHYDLWEKP